MRTNGRPRPTRLLMLGIGSILLIASGCATSGITTGIETVAPSDPGKPATERLSLCEIISRDELRYSRRDTEETKENLGRVLVKYDATCPGAGS